MLNRFNLIVLRLGILQGKGVRNGVSDEARGGAFGITFGSALAIAISWSVNKSIVWAIIHGLLSWIYVVYYALTAD